MANKKSKTIEKSYSYDKGNYYKALILSFFITLFSIVMLSVDIFTKSVIAVATGLCLLTTSIFLFANSIKNIKISISNNENEFDKYEDHNNVNKQRTEEEKLALAAEMNSTFADVDDK